jgi:thioredoxin 2
MLLDRPYKLTEETFQRTIADAEVPVLVDFYADWCGPCKIMAPFVDDVAKSYMGRALVTKLDTDRAPKLSASLNIRGIPTTIVFKGGKEVERQTGAVPKAVLEQMLVTALSATREAGI